MVVRNLSLFRSSEQAADRRTFGERSHSMSLPSIQAGRALRIPPSFSHQVCCPDFWPSDSDVSMKHGI